MSNRYDRQSFLGSRSQEQIEATKVGIVGLGGGGSHIVQQLAHIGFKRYALYDFDVVEDTNLNRLVGATRNDAIAATEKLHLAKMMVLGLQPDADIDAVSKPWQEDPQGLKDCHIIFGCIETYRGRQDLERHCRRYLAHYIDIGMDVHPGPSIGGQVILSSVGDLCMTCMEFLTEEALATEARKYGEAGSRPQVIWPNGVLASTAVGFGVDLVTNWTRQGQRSRFLRYDGLDGVLKPSARARSWPSTCAHFSSEPIGDPIFTPL